jgi:tRNA A37 threonylcarbamoyladenosine biosynthesis protein TsaE
LLSSENGTHRMIASTIAARSTTSRRQPVIVLLGFVGAGKTMLLGHVVNDRRCCAWR